MAGAAGAGVTGGGPTPSRCAHQINKCYRMNNASISVTASEKSGEDICQRSVLFESYHQQMCLPWPAGSVSDLQLDLSAEQSVCVHHVSAVYTHARRRTHQHSFCLPS